MKHSDTIKDVKNKLKEKYGVPSDSGYNIVFRSCKCTDEQTLESLLIWKEATLHLILPKDFKYEGGEEEDDERIHPVNLRVCMGNIIT